MKPGDRVAYSSPTRRPDGTSVYIEGEVVELRAEGKVVVIRDDNGNNCYAKSYMVVSLEEEEEMSDTRLMLENPYLDIYKAALEHEIAAGRTLAWMDKQPSGYCTCYECLPVGEMESGRPQYDRHALVRRYSFAVPDEDAISSISGLKMPIMELGAGTGYWAWILSQANVEVMAFDLLPPGIPETQNGYHFEKTFYDVYPCDGPEFLKVCKFCNEFALMLCWPDLDTLFAHDTLRAYQERGGETFIYIGEGPGGCTAEDKFFELLEDYWTLDTEVDIPQWSGIRDYLGIYRRKQ